MAHSEWHPDEAALLQAIDGELTAQAVDAVSDHLRGCPECEARSERLEHALREASVLLRDEQQRQLPAFAASRRDFRARLSALDRERQRPSLWQRANSILRRRNMWRTAALLGASAACVLLFLFFYPERKLRTVSARDVLERASVAHTREVARTVAPAVRQKLRIKVGGQEMTRTIYRDLRGRKQWDLWDGARRPAKSAPPAAEALRQRLADSPIDWNDPLSPERFTRWYTLHANKELDRVAEDGGVVSVQASADSGPVLQASLRLRAADYHPIGESLSFADRQSVEISELEYEVLRDGQELAQLVSPAPAPQALKRTNDAGDAEILARSILHDAGADLGGEIQVRSGENGTVEVSGFAGSAHRRTELETALARVPGVVTKLTTVDDMPAREYGAPVGSGPSGAAAQSVPLAEMLADRIPDSMEREAFAGKALDLSQAMLSHAFALSRLGDRYSPEAESRLSASGRAALRKMAVDHAAIIRQTARSLRQQIGSVFGEVEETPGAPVSSGPWQDRRSAVLSAAQKVDAGLTALFTGSRESITENQRKAAIPAEIMQLEAMAAGVEKDLAATGNPDP